MCAEEEIKYNEVTLDYEVMTDRDGVKWDVPVKTDGIELQYMVRHNPADPQHTFKRVTLVKKKDH